MIGKFGFFFKRSYIPLAAFFIINGCGTPAPQKETPERAHSKMACGTCHESHDGEIKMGSLLVRDPDSLCLKCHKPGKGDHAVGEVPKINRQNLPLGPDGKITCALTCHNVHTNSDDPVVIRGLLRLHPNELCLSCHDK